MGGRGGGTPASLAPLPSVLGAGEGREGAPPNPPECKQQQMNKNKNTKGRRKVPGIPPTPGVFPVTRGGPHAALSTEAASVLGAAGQVPGGRVQGSELLGQQVTQVTGHGLLARAQSQPVHLSLGIGFQPE